MPDAQSCEVGASLHSVGPYAYGWLLHLLLVTVIMIYWLLLCGRCWLVRFLCYYGIWAAVVTAITVGSCGWLLFLPAVTALRKECE
jgi:hypothetical protein